MKAGRLLSELMLLQARGRVSTRELAERMEISRRTAHRDMEALCAAGVPLVALRGVFGGWELDAGWRTKAPGFDEDELIGFLLARASPPGPGNLGAAADRAMNKILAAMPAAQRSRAAALREKMHVDPAGWGPWSEDASAVPLIQEAIARNRKLTFDYRTRDKREGTRTADPLGLVWKENTWYRVARVSGGLRTFRVSRMAKAALLPGEFQPPANFDLKAYWKAAAAELAARGRGYQAILALAPGVAVELGRWRQLRSVPLPPHSGTLPEAWTTFSADFDDEPQALFCALGLGSQVIVVSPTGLKKRVATEIRGALMLNPSA
ncbi:MAG: YafY family transcriptional regulator [Bryobacterales bacterium]|nr:YafY family transcriptional regulator [Bryobacterales bacterium]